MDMDINIKEIEDYIIASRIALTIDSTDPINLEEVDTLLVKLRQYLSCRVCLKLPDRLNPYSDGFICTVCLNNHPIIENTSISAIQKYYKALCDFIRTSPFYAVICENNENRRLVELVTEMFSLSHPINGHNSLNGVSNKQQTEVIDVQYNVDLNSSSDVQLLKNNERTDYSNLQLIDMQSQNCKTQTLLNTISTDIKKTKRRGSSCDDSTFKIGEQTSFGQSYRCSTEQKPRDDRRRNPKQKSSNNDGDLDIGKVRCKPATVASLEVGSSIGPPLIKSKPVHLEYRMHDRIQFSSHSEDGTEVTQDKILQTNKKGRHKKKKMNLPLYKTFKWKT